MIEKDKIWKDPSLIRTQQHHKENVDMRHCSHSHGKKNHHAEGKIAAVEHTQDEEHKKPCGKIVVTVSPTALPVD